MSEFGETLLRDVRKTLSSSVSTDRKLRAIAKRIADSTDFVDAGDYAVRIGELLSQALISSTSGMAYISRDVAEELLRPLLTQNHQMVTDVCRIVEENMNSAIGINVGAVLPDLDTSRISGLIDKVSSYSTMDEAQWVLGEPIVNYAQSIVDQSIEKTAKTSNALGLTAYITRKAEPTAYKTIKRGKKSYRYKIPCKWCAGLEGKYEYRGNGSNVPQDVFRRHESCRCTVTLTRDRTKQDVWSKQEWSDDDASAVSDRVRQREQAQTQTQQSEQRERRQNLSNVDYVSAQTGYSPQSASMLLRQYSNEVRSNGVDWLIDLIRSQNQFARR